MVKDNWEHRSENMLCRTCMWYVPKNEKLGRCRQHAPTIKGFPAMFPTDWCGDHKIDETKIKKRLVGVYGGCHNCGKEFLDGEAIYLSKTGFDICKECYEKEAKKRGR